MPSATLLPVLEIKRRGDPTEGSNPSFSAKPNKQLKKPFVIERLFSCLVKYFSSARFVDASFFAVSFSLLQQRVSS